MDTPSTPHPSLTYRPAVDGLRAVAVLSVFVFHMDHRWLPGGFLGVDVFFVISGYLIASIIFKECRTGSLDLAAFYQRRIARIMPVFLTVALATLAAAYLFYSEQDLASAGILFSAAAASVANLKLILQGSYFEIFPDAQPYLHYWSLSVEEQFYLVFPVLALWVFRYGGRRRAVLFHGLAVLSLLSCIVLTRLRPVWAFYLLPTRAWELLAGCILAYHLPSATEPRGRLLPGALSAAGMAAVALSMLFVHDGPRFPGIWPLLPVAGAVCILLPVAGPGSLTERLLSAGPLTAVGRTSYSLYLWHWPIFSFVDYRLFMAPGPARLGLKVALSAAAAALSYKFLERPARTWLNRRGNRPAAYAFLAGTLALCVPLGIAVRKSSYVNAELADVAKGGIVFAPAGYTRSVVLMGDSNGSMYGSALKQACAELGYKLTVISVAAGDPLPDPDASHGALWLDSLAVVRAERPDVLVLACRWESKLKGRPERLAQAVGSLGPLVGHLVILNQPPIAPKTASRASIRNGARPPFLEDPATRRSRLEANAFLETLRSGKTSVVDIASSFQGSDGEVLFIDSHGKLLYQDEWHLSGYGTGIVRTLLAQAISAQPPKP